MRRIVFFVYNLHLDLIESRRVRLIVGMLILWAFCSLPILLAVSWISDNEILPDLPPLRDPQAVSREDFEAERKAFALLRLDGDDNEHWHRGAPTPTWRGEINRQDQAEIKREWDNPFYFDQRFLEFQERYKDLKR